MDLTAGTRATAIGAALITSAGLGIVLYGIITNDLKRSIGGVAFALCALTFIALVVIRRWITDTNVERRRLDDAVRQADADRMRYVAAQAALEAERARVRHDVAVERQQLTVRLEAERAAMDEQFEEARSQLIIDTTEAAVRLIGSGFPNNVSAPVYARVIELPSPAHQRAAAESTRGRGATRG